MSTSCALFAMMLPLGSIQVYIVSGVGLTTLRFTVWPTQALLFVKLFSILGDTDVSVIAISIDSEVDSPHIPLLTRTW